MSRVGAAVLAAALALTSAAACGSSDDAGSATTVTTAASGATTTASATGTTPTSSPTAHVDANIALQRIADVPDATDLAPRQGDTSLYVTARTGKVRRITVTTAADGAKSYALESAPVLDITKSVVSGGQEQGLLGLAFSPDGANLFVAYTGTDSNQHVDEYAMGTTTADTQSKRSIISIDDFAPNHNGGDLVFGPDGYLYYGMGDGGGGGDPKDTGQDPSDLLANLLRIDPDGATGSEAYAVPPDNPFADGGGAPEVYAYGLRNPWRFSFDRDNGDLWIGDVGQNEWEEIDWAPADNGQDAGKGDNFGWSEMEGTHPYGDGEPPDGADAPVYEYSHADGGCSVTGGFVYRGTAIPALSGVYLFADFCVGDLLGLLHNGSRVTDVASLDVHLDSPSSFGQDADGELYVVSLSGDVDKIVPA